MLLCCEGGVHRYTLELLIIYYLYNLRMSWHVYTRVMGVVYSSIRRGGDTGGHYLSPNEVLDQGTQEHKKN